MATFKAFKPSGMEKIARSMGYQGSMDGFNQFVAQDPKRQQQMQQYQQQAMQMARGGVVTMQTGGDIRTGPAPVEGVNETTDIKEQSIGDVTADRMSNPALPVGGKTDAATISYDEGQEVETGLGQV